MVAFNIYLIFFTKFIPISNSNTVKLVLDIHVVRKIKHINTTIFQLKYETLALNNDECLGNVKTFVNIIPLQI